MTDGHKKALELIAENKRTRSPFLDLGNLGLTEVPEEVFECVWLENLNLGRNPYGITNEKDKNPSRKKNGIIQIPHRIGILQNLRILTASDNKIGSIRSLRKIAKLEKLDLSGNFISNLIPLTYLRKLNYLNVEGNNIQLLPKELFLLIRNIYFVKIKEKANIEEGIFLGGNYISTPPPEILKRGEKAVLAFFESNTYSEGISLEILFELFDEANEKYFQYFDAPKSFEFEYVEEQLLKLHGNYDNWRIEDLHHEKNGASESFVFSIIINAIDADTESIIIKINLVEEPLNQLKTLLVGDGLSGKTSLLKQILKKEFDAGEPQTHGINIHPKDIEIEGENIHVKFWDFGGQEIMHGTHTFFYSKRSIYLLVLDARREGKEDYWLKHIESFGGDSPVLVVLNKIDENPSFDVNRAFLQNKYPNIVGFVRVSCKTGDGIDLLVQELEKQIHALEMRRTPFAKSWFEVKEALDTMGKDYITYEDYYALCHEKEVTDETAQNVLLQFLHDLGIVLAFRNLELHDTQVINPLWLTNAVYRIINSKLVAGKKGRLDLSDLDAILNDPTYAHEGFKYPRNKFLYIVKIMQEFELCYRIAEEVFIVPDLLTVEEQPVPDFGYDTALRFVLQYDFLPASVLPRFMVQLHTRIVEGEQWRTGTALEDPIFKSKAVVKADRDEKRLYIWVNGPDRDSRRNFFNFIRKTLHDIHDSFEKLTVTELVPVPGHDDIFIEYAELVGYEEMGLADYPVGKLRRKFNVGEMLNGLEAPERRQPRRHAPVKVFVSYSHKDAEYKDELVTALAYLARMEEIELWQDGRIEAGMEWRKEIFEKLAEAEIVICLVSSNFIASDFCYSVELKEALEGHEAGTKIVVPIQIKTCAWTKLPFGKIQGLPSKPISAFEPRDDGWGEVFAGMEGAVKRVREKR